VCSGNTEANPGGDQRSGGIADDDDRDLAAEHFVGEGGHLGRVVDENWNDWRIVVTIYNVSKTFQSKSQVS
jgi:hypothetical protein